MADGVLNGQVHDHDGSGGTMTQTTFEAGYVADSPIAHAAYRTLNGHRSLCGQRPDRMTGRFDTTDEQACPHCLDVALST
ncbi:MAG TPA: hypothetical protein VHW74_14640 [Mycobacteriales bacterium]|nr:hypothetical protein [Mycobacteriales bacterium]